MDNSNGVNNLQAPKSDTKRGFLTQIEEEIGKIYSKINFHLPLGLKNFIVNFGPWIALILIILAIPAMLIAVGIGAIFAPVAMMYGGAHMGGFFFIAGLVTLFSLILEGMALPGLFKKQIGGWRLMLYGILVSSIASLLYGNLGGLIIGTILSLYVLYEVKSYYH